MKSNKPRKKRKELYNMPLHKRKKILTATLSKELRKEFGTRNMPMRKSDKVIVMRGDHKGVRGKIREVDTKNFKVYLEEITKKKVDGTEIHISLHPSNLMIIDPDMSDPKREKIVNRRGGKVKEERKKVEEVKEEIKEVKEKGFKCPVCSEIFSTKNDLNVHIGQKHKEYAR
jgi:large subunit ribosomal protein L24